MRLQESSVLVSCMLGLVVSSCLSAGTTRRPTDAELPSSDLLGVWEGEFEQHSHTYNRSYPMVLEVESADDSGLVKGTLGWPVPNDSKTSFTGEYVNGVLHLHERELLQGGNIMLGGDYYAFVTSSGGLLGRYVCTDGDHAEGFELRRQGQTGPNEHR